ncbi:uncharacterized protein [Clytia hemisphaerica]|uniref:uncharacterized protein n=1 Tax=Clytia hemisphaerica TaxID=252671 RepID=UPI0034D74BC5
MQRQIQAVYVDSDKPVDISNEIGQINQDTMIKLLLGKPLNNQPLFSQWFSTTQKLIRKLDPNYGSKDEIYKQLHEKVIEFVRTTPVAQQLRNTPHKATLEKELMFFTFGFAAGGVELAMKAVFHYWKDLPSIQQKQITNEAKRFLSKRLTRGNFGNLMRHRIPFITKFVMEVLRSDTPVSNVFGIARKDFVVSSMNGRYLIKKGTHLQGNVLSVQRNPIIFTQDNEGFSMVRNQTVVKRNFFAFGGPYSQRVTVINNKCFGQELGINFLQMLVLQISQCDVKIESTPQLLPKTGLYSIDVSKFKCY